jgi:hypothetical protein
MRWWIGLCVGLLLCTASLSSPDDRRGSPFPSESLSEKVTLYLLAA